MKIPALQHIFSLQKTLVLTKKPKPKHNIFFFLMNGVFKV